ncbi:MAG: DMT family transporter [Pseudomonadota bacterium]
MENSQMQANNHKKYLMGLLIAVIGAILFSGKAILAKLIYRYQVDAVTLLFFRMSFSLPFFAAIALWKTITLPPLLKNDRISIVVLGLLGYYLSSFLDFLGLQYINAGLERLILFLTPSFVLLISVLFLKKRISRFEVGALFVCYAGVVLVFINDAFKGGKNIILGSAFVLVSAISYALYLIFSDKLVKRVGTIRLVAYAMCVSSLACIIQFFILRSPSLLTQPVAVYGYSVMNAIFCTVMPVFLTMWAVERVGASTASQAGMIGPVSTLILGAFILNEPITWIQIIGTLLVLSGIYLLSKKRT